MSFTTLRIKFGRKGPISYLGHLDVLRYFQKAIARAGLDVRYSEGFNPHMIISFAYPLGVSMETLGDYVDVDFITYESCDVIMDSLNRVMNEGIYIIEVSVVPEGENSAMAAVALADYRIYGNLEQVSQKMIIDYLSQNEINIEKEGKKGINTVDIKPGIIEITKEDNNSENTLFMKLLSGSGLNIKPASVLETLGTFASLELKAEKIVRLEIYREKDGAFIPLGYK